jgi:hypothetical protein
VNLLITARGFRTRSLPVARGEHEPAHVCTPACVASRPGSPRGHMNGGSYALATGDSFPVCDAETAVEEVSHLAETAWRPNMRHSNCGRSCVYEHAS